MTIWTRPIAAVMVAEAASMAVFSALHLSGALHLGGDSARALPAGIAEAIICVALLSGVGAMLRRGPHARGVAIGAVSFAIAGFALGLSITVGGGATADLAYHATMLPLLLATLVVLLRRPAAVGKVE